MIQRNVAAAPVDIRIITSIFDFPSSPAKRTAAVNYQTELTKTVFFRISNSSSAKSFQMLRYVYFLS